MTTYFENLDDMMLEAHESAEPKTDSIVWEKLEKRYYPRGRAFRRMLSKHLNYSLFAMACDETKIT